ncbi:hypothetical protein SLA2020_374120 [Shorea laevis]
MATKVIERRWLVHGLCGWKLTLWGHTIPLFILSHHHHRGFFNHLQNPCCTEGSTIHPFRISDFGAFEQSVGFRVEEAVNLSADTVFNSTKVGGHMVPSDPLNIGTFDKAHKVP